MRAAYKVDDLEAASGPGREGRGVEWVASEDHAELRGEVVATEEVVVIRHGGQAGHSCLVLLLEPGLHELLERVQARAVRLGLPHDVLHEDARGGGAEPGGEHWATSSNADEERVHLVVHLVRVRVS